MVQSINEQIANYREVLNQRGVPKKWLDRAFFTHRASMMEQEAYNLDVASGHSSDTVHNCNAYHYPENYSDFYEQLTNDFRAFAPLLLIRIIILEKLISDILTVNVVFRPMKCCAVD